MRRSLAVSLFLLVPLSLSAAPRLRSVAQPRDCGPLAPAPASTPYFLRYDQLGYLPEGERWAVLVSSGERPPRFRIVEADSHCPVAEGIAGPRVADVQTRASTRMTADRVDLSGIRANGRYLVILEDGSRHGPIVVGPNVYGQVAAKSMRFFKVQRCGPVDARESIHGSCHLYSSIVDGDPRTFSGDGIVVPYGSRATVSSGDAVNVEGGWHDAGDYIKFTGTTSLVVTMQLLALRDHPAVFAGTGLREEARHGLDWLVKMIDRDQPLVQVSGEADHRRIRMPEDDTRNPLPEYQQRPAVRFQSGAGRNLFGRSAAAFAIASEVYGEPALLAAARRAYDKARAFPAPQPSDPDRFYGETSTDDDIALGAAELARVTREATYIADALRYSRRIDSNDVVVGWPSVGALALSETGLLFLRNSPEHLEMTNQLNALVAPIARMKSAPSGPAAAYEYALPRLGNGSMAEALGAAAACLAANRLAPHADCVEVARAQLHWLFGQNPFGLSFMIGAGNAWPQKPHHNIAMNRAVFLEGAIVGGPTHRDELDTSPGRSGPFARFSTTEVLYEDLEDQYVMNEPAIDFHGPLLFILGELLER